MRAPVAPNGHLLRVVCQNDLNLKNMQSNYKYNIITDYTYTHTSVEGNTSMVSSFVWMMKLCSFKFFLSFFSPTFSYSLY